MVWRRMLLTIDGVTEPEADAILKVLPSFEIIKKLNGRNDDQLFQKLCSTNVERGEGALKRTQRLGPMLAHRILNTFDDKDSDFVLD